MKLEISAAGEDVDCSATMKVQKSQQVIMLICRFEELEVALILNIERIYNFPSLQVLGIRGA
jgi:hypothetical protein